MSSNTSVRAIMGQLIAAGTTNNINIPGSSAQATQRSDPFDDIWNFRKRPPPLNHAQISSDVAFLRRLSGWSEWQKILALQDRNSRKPLILVPKAAAREERVRKEARKRDEVIENLVKGGLMEEGRGRGYEGDVEESTDDDDGKREGYGVWIRGSETEREEDGDESACDVRRDLGEDEEDEIEDDEETGVESGETTEELTADSGNGDED